MLPAGEITEETVTALGGLLEPGRHRDRRRQQLLSRTTSAAPRHSPQRRLHYLDVGTSGGVWGLERGYCMMIGGPKAAVERLTPIFEALAPGVGEIPRTAGPRGPRPARRARLHPRRPERGRALRQDDPQRHRVRPDAGLCRGLRHPQKQGRGRSCPRRSATSSTSPTSPRCGGAAASSPPGCSTSPRLALAENATPVELHRLGGRFRRGPLDDPGGDRGGGAGRRALGRALRPLPLAPGPHLRRAAAVGDALQVRRPCRAAGRRLTPMAAATGRARQAGSDHGRAGAALRAGDLRRWRRPDPAAADAGPLQPGGAPSCSTDRFAMLGVNHRRALRRRLPRRPDRGDAQLRRRQGRRRLRPTGSTMPPAAG